jgi:hypothetical protein
MAKKSKAKAPKKTAKASKQAKKGTKKAAKRAKAPKKGSRAAKKSAKAAPRASAKGTGRATKAKKGKSVKKTAKRATQARKTSTARSMAAVGKRPNLERERRTVQEDIHGVPSSLNMDRTASSARSGRHEFEQKLREHTSTGPAMTGGDVDADWEDAETVGDEAPGGDNPTPDQDIVDEIGKAMGIEYDDDEELQGGDELAERDRHRWELDPASKDDFEDE